MATEERWLVDATGWRGVSSRPEVYKLVKETDKTFTVQERRFNITAGPRWGAPRRKSKAPFMGVAHSEEGADQMVSDYVSAYQSFDDRIRELKDELRKVNEEQRAACLKALGIVEP